MKNELSHSQAKRAHQAEDQKLYLYKAFGLNICSCFEIPQLIPSVGAPDVYIRFGYVPESLENPLETGVRYQAKPGVFLLKKDNIAKYLVTNGNEIIIDKATEPADRDLIIFLLGSVIAALLQQRGSFPIHASAIKVKDQCILFSGPSGSGKSTLAKAFVKRGYELHSDDICAVSINSQGTPIAHSSYPQMKLWKDTLKKIQENPDTYARVRHPLLKFAVPVREQFSHEQLAIKKIYLLSPYNGHQIQIYPITGFEKFSALTNQTYRRQFTAPLGKSENIFKAVSSIGKHTPVYYVKRPQKPFLLKELTDLLEQDILA